MTEYHKIQSIFKRDMEHPQRPLIEGQWTLDEFEYLANNQWEFTEKVDGTNIRVIFEDGKLTFGGRTEQAQIPASLVGKLNDIFLPLVPELKSMFDGQRIVFYGEGYGAKIQKGGGNYRQDQSFVLFDIRIGLLWLLRKDVVNIGEKLGIEVVPVICEGTLYDAVKLAKTGIRSYWGNFEAEGIVARPKIEIQGRAGFRIIAKIKCRDFV